MNLDTKNLALLEVIEWYNGHKFLSDETVSQLRDLISKENGLEELKDDELVT